MTTTRVQTSSRPDAPANHASQALERLSEPAGAYMTMIVGAIYAAVALHAVLAESWWDAGFYGVTNLALIVLAGAVRWLQAQPRGGSVP